MPNTITTRIGAKTYTEIDPNAELDYTFDLDDWCTARSVSIASYTVAPVAGSDLEVLEDTRSSNQISVTVRLATPAARPTRADLVDGVTVRFTTTASPRTGSALVDDRTLWFVSREA